MNEINLLPWRDWRRERARRSFFLSLGLAAMLAVAATAGLGWRLDRESQQLDRRNDYLRERIAGLDRRIADIAELNGEADQVLSRLAAARALQGNRYAMVHVFDALARAVADGAHYTSVSMAGDLISASGAAASNDQVSALMRRIEDSRWFAEPSLKSISEARDGAHYGGRSSEFELTFRRSDEV